MDSEAPEEINACAIEWHVKLRHGDDATWDAFAFWIAESPAHAAAYDRIEQADLAMDPLLGDIRFHEAANDQDDATAMVPSRMRRWGWAGGAIAASLAVVLAIAPQFGSSRYDVQTGPGETREIALDGATRVILNGSTHIILDHKDARFAALQTGEALFSVRHDANHPFAVMVGDSQVTDVGTIFNVVRDGDDVRVAVAQGEVAYHVRKTSTPLKAGQTLLDRTVDGTLKVARSPLSVIGGWHKGRLTYAGEPLSQVASDLGRSLGLSISVAPAIAERPSFGTIVLDGKGAAKLQSLAPALDVRVEQSSGGWILRPVAGERP